MKLTKRDDVDFSGDVLKYDPAQEANPRFKYEDTVSTGYTELTSISDWTTYGERTIGAYRTFRNELISNFTSWATYSDADKKLLIEHYVYLSTETSDNLDLLYSEQARDDFQKQVLKLLDSTGITTDQPLLAISEDKGSVVQKTFSDSPYSSAWGDCIEVDCSEGDVTVTLLTAVGYNGKRVDIQKVDSSTNKIIVNCSGAETINGDPTCEITSQWENVSLTSNNSNITIK